MIGGQGSPIVEVAAGNEPFTLTVLPINDCGAGAPASLLVEPQVVSTSAIEGPALVNCSTDGELYSVAEQAGSVFTWSVPAGAVIISGQGGNSIVVDFNGAFGAVSVVETNAFGCSGDTVVIAVECSTTTGVLESTLPDPLVYPNPVRDQLHFQWHRSSAHLQVFDAQGRQVHEGTLLSPVFPVQGMARGLYTGILHHEDGQLSFRFIKE